jgi:hypothetical protein
MSQVSIANMDDIKKAIEPLVKEVLMDFIRLLKIDGFNFGQDEWVPLLEAQKILPLKSRKKWKELRDLAQVDFTRAGKGFVYHKPSLIKYLEKNSTIRKQIRK